MPELSVTELPAFKRLARFLEEVNSYALGDPVLMEIVNRCHTDLMHIVAENPNPLGIPDAS